MKEPEKFLLSLIDYEKTGGMVRSLMPFRKALKKLGNPERELKNTILVVGTKGKGSVSMHIAKAISNIGYKVGLFTSPHLVSFRERIKINDKEISKERFAYILDMVSRRLPGRGIRTVFQALTATAFIYFLEEEVDFSIFEVGLGGRLDSTNVLRQERTAFTKIGYDHTKILGTTLKSIASEKAGVIKNRNPIFSARQRKGVGSILKDRADRFNAPLWELETDIPLGISEITVKGNHFSIKFFGRENEIFTPAPGIFQVENAAIAASVLLSLSLDKINFDGLKIPGRFEIINSQPYVVLDGAHNLLSMNALIQSVEYLLSPRRLYVVFGINRDKPIKKVLLTLKEKVYFLFTTQVPLPRAMPAPRISDIARSLGIKKVRSVSEPIHALQEAVKQAEPGDVVLVTGSFYLVGEIKKFEDQLNFCTKSKDNPSGFGRG